MDFMLTILGSSAAIPAHGRGLSAQVLRHGSSVFLIDCGEGTQYQLSQYHIKRSQIDYVFVSHMHGDHIFGLPGLLGTFAIQGRQKLLNIIGPPGLESYVNANLEYSNSHLPFQLNFEIVDTNISRKILSLEKMDVYSISLHHRIPCTGYKFVERRDYSIIKETIEKFKLNFEQIRQLKKGKKISKLTMGWC